MTQMVVLDMLVMQIGMLCFFLDVLNKVKSSEHWLGHIYMASGAHMSKPPIRSEEYRNKVAELTIKGKSANEISEILHISTRTVTRIRTDTGVMAGSRSIPMTEEEIEKARNLLEAGAPYAEVGRSIGRSHHAITRNLPGYHKWSPAEASRLATLTRKLNKL